VLQLKYQIKMIGMSKGIPVHSLIFGAKAANLKHEQTSAKLPEVLPLDKIILNSLMLIKIQLDATVCRYLFTA